MQQELTIIEVSDILGISEKTILSKWKQCKPKAEQFGIVKEGKGKKAIYIQTISENKNKIAFDILREYLINECGFNTRTDFNKLIQYIYLVLLNSCGDENYTFNNSLYSDAINIAVKNLIEYRRKLTECGFMKSKDLSQGTYAYLDIIKEKWVKCDVKVFDSFKECIKIEAQRLLKDNYLLDLTKQTDYNKAKNIICSDEFDIEEIIKDIKGLNIDEKRKYIRDTVNNINLEITDEDNSRFYKIALFEVSEAWKEEFGIANVRFFPNHMLSDNILKDSCFIEIIINAYKYITNN